MIGSCPAMQTVFELINAVANSSSTVLITGETGTGKELVARAIHKASQRKTSLMVTVNCAAIPANLIESELFGHEKGSFTDAYERRIGKFEMANNGTIFLDEISEMPLELQVKLLRVLQEREIERVGGKKPMKIDVRVVAATNRELDKMVDDGRFRRDLFYRLNVFPIIMPTLKERVQDIPDLATYFLDKYSRIAGKNIYAISEQAQRDLANYHWPGNIRELEHIIERSVLLSNNNVLKEVHLPKPLLSTKDGAFRYKTIADNEREHIIQTILRCRLKLSGKGGAAEMLGVPVSTLHSKMKKLGITRQEITKMEVLKIN